MNVLLVLFIIGFIFYIVNCAVLLETLSKVLKKGYCEKKTKTNHHSHWNAYIQRIFFHIDAWLNRSKRVVNIAVKKKEINYDH